MFELILKAYNYLLSLESSPYSFVTLHPMQEQGWGELFCSSFSKLNSYSEADENKWRM
jgi:hypothetical protein